MKINSGYKNHTRTRNFRIERPMSMALSGSVRATIAYQNEPNYDRIKTASVSDPKLTIKSNNERKNFVSKKTTEKKPAKRIANKNIDLNTNKDYRSDRAADVPSLQFYLIYLSRMNLQNWPKKKLIVSRGSFAIESVCHRLDWTAISYAGRRSHVPSGRCIGQF